MCCLPSSRVVLLSFGEELHTAVGGLGQRDPSGAARSPPDSALHPPRDPFSLWKSLSGEGTLGKWVLKTHRSTCHFFLRHTAAANSTLGFLEGG